MKETIELYILLGSLINAGYASLEDGEINFGDVGKVFDPLMKGQDGVQGVGEYPTEQATATPDQKEEALARLAAELKNLPADDAYDLRNIAAGAQSIVSIMVRKTRKSTADQIAAALNSGPRPAAADGGRPVTGEELLALIAPSGSEEE